jgi:acyl carrier protein
MSDAVKDKVTDKIVAILAEQAVVDTADVSMASTLEDLGIDSLGLVEAVFAIEEAFDVQVPFNANDPSASEFDISTVETMVRAVEKLIAAQS